MKKFIGILILAFICNIGYSQTWYQKEKKFHPFLSAAAAVGSVDILKDIHAWKDQQVWSAIEVGIMNKNTGIGIATTSYEWNSKTNNYVSLAIERRLFYVGRFEPWVGLAYSIPFKGKPEMKIQPSAGVRIQLHKALAIEFDYAQVLNKNQNWRLTANRSVAIGVIIAFHGHVDSNDK